MRPIVVVALVVAASMAHASDNGRRPLPQSIPLQPGLVWEYVSPSAADVIVVPVAGAVMVHLPDDIDGIRIPSAKQMHWFDEVPEAGTALDLGEGVSFQLWGARPETFATFSKTHTPTCVIVEALVGPETFRIALIVDPRVEAPDAVAIRSRLRLSAVTHRLRGFLKSARRHVVLNKPPSVNLSRCR